MPFLGQFDFTFFFVSLLITNVPREKTDRRRQHFVRFSMHWPAIFLLAQPKTFQSKCSQLHQAKCMNLLHFINCSLNQGLNSNLKRWKSNTITTCYFALLSRHCSLLTVTLCVIKANLLFTSFHQMFIKLLSTVCFHLAVATEQL